MAFRTNKVPAIEERTVSGSSVSFNSAFALPLKACKVSFSATQSGSGTPSPSNPLPISGVSAIGLTVNSTPVSVSLGDTRYGGELDLLTGELTVTDVAYKIKDLAFSYDSEYGRFQSNDYKASRLAPINNGTIVEGLMCECYISGRATSGSGEQYPDKRVAVAAVSSTLFIYDSSYTDVNTMKSAVGNYYVKWRLKESSYITIQLFANELSSIIGNNTFSTDTGTLEITFADLQEKSASGSVASFNTALAMPLVECKTEFMFTQSGTGDPTPQNIRPFVTISEITIDANSNTFTCDLNGNRAGGVIDLVNKIGTITWIIQKISDMQVAYHPASTAYPFGFYILRGKPRKKPGVSNVASEIFQVGGINWSVNYRSFGNGSNDYIYVVTSDYTSANDFKSNFGNYEFAYELETPIQISLSDIPTLSTINGNNSFASDSGSIELKYKDLDIAKRGNFREVFKLPS